MKLETYLAERGISPADFAAQIGANLATVYRLKGGAQIPTKDMMHRIYEATGGDVQANDFYGHAA